MLKKKYILPRKKNIMQNAKVIRTDYFLVKYEKNNLDFPRFAVIVPKKLTKKSVIKNKIKRKIKTILKDYIDIGSFDFLIFMLKLETNFWVLKEKIKEVFDLLKQSNQC
jgi:ribonuclease P protein component